MPYIQSNKVIYHPGNTEVFKFIKSNSVILRTFAKFPGDKITLNLHGYVKRTFCCWHS